MRHASTISFIIIAFMPLALCACEADNKDTPPAADKPAKTAPAATAEESTHAPTGVVPGSYEDWCGEHQVPESLCTRCNPSLIPAFKATGDWCEEHGLPDSQCLIHHPDLKIERPPRPGAAQP